MIKYKYRFLLLFQCLINLIFIKDVLCESYLNNKLSSQNIFTTFNIPVNETGTATTLMLLGSQNFSPLKNLSNITTLTTVSIFLALTNSLASFKVGNIVPTFLNLKSTNNNKNVFLTNSLASFKVGNIVPTFLNLKSTNNNKNVFLTNSLASSFDSIKTNTDQREADRLDEQARQLEIQRLINEQVAENQQLETDQREADRLDEQARQLEIQRLINEQVAENQQLEVERVHVAAEQAEARQRVETGALAEEDLAARPIEWTSMTKIQKILRIINKICQDKILRNNYSILADPQAHLLLKSIFQELVTEGYININTIIITNHEPENLRFLVPNISSVLKKTIFIQKYENTPYSMTRKEANDFYTFTNKYVEFVDFSLEMKHQLSLYQALKLGFHEVPWPNILEVLDIILKNSLPMDYEEWPNFIANPNANFNDFIYKIITPFINTIAGNSNFQEVDQSYINDLLLNKQKYRKLNIDYKIETYQNANQQYIHDQITEHGLKIPMPSYFILSNRPPEINFSTWTQNIIQKLMDLEDQTSTYPSLKYRINYSNLCLNPFMYLLREPDFRLISLKNNYDHHSNEIDNLISQILDLIPVDEAIMDDEFRKCFRGTDFCLAVENPTNKDVIIRLKRLYQCIKDNYDELTAARIIYAFGAENYTRCVDGKNERIIELERQYVYVVNDLRVNEDLDSIIGLNLSKLFMDDRADKLRNAIYHIYDPGEPRTYAWARSYRVLHLGFGLSGKYEDIIFGHAHTEGVKPIEFVETYFKGGQILGNPSCSYTESQVLANVLSRVYDMEPFTVNKMINIALQNIKTTIGSLFDDHTLDYFINSNLSIRKAYKEFQEHVEEENFENSYFRNGTLRQREAIKEEAIIELLKTYNYIYQRNDEDGKWK